MTLEMDKGLMMFSFLWHDIGSRDGRKQKGSGRVQESSGRGQAVAEGGEEQLKEVSQEKPIHDIFISMILIWLLLS